MKLFFYKIKILLLRAIGYEKPYRVAILKLASLIFKKFRPHYEVIVFKSCLEAKKIGINQVSILELGVASGAGILSLEKYCKKIEKILNIKINIYGFDLGTGLPKTNFPVEDLRFYWKEGLFKSNNFNTNKSKIYIGNIKDKVNEFIKDNPYPISAIFFDLDLYSSTKDFLDKINLMKDFLLPRTICYFDDIYNINNYLSDINGELLAIKEFNELNTEFKMTKSTDSILDYKFPLARNNIFMLHYFLHSKYHDFIGYDTEDISPRSKYIRSLLD